MLDYVEKAELERLAPSVYRFKGIDTSPLAKWLSPKWDAMVHLLIPAWMAPNVLTVSGLVLLVFNFLLICSYRPLTENHHVPRWVWLVAAWNAFWAYALDCMDGKQARRTGTSSALGELIDHGCDAFSIWTITFTLGVLTQYSEDGPLGQGWTILFWMCVSLFGFFSAHWESYNTHQFFLPWSFDVGEISVVVVFLVSFVFGHDVWLWEIPGAAFLKGGQAVELREVLALMTMSFVVLDGIRIAIIVFRRGGKGSWRRVFEPLVYILFCFFSVYVFAAALGQAMLAKMVHRVVVILGFNFCNVVTRLILAHVAEREVRADWGVLFVPLVSAIDLVGLAALRGAPLIDPVTHINLQILVAGANHMYYAVMSTRAFCNHFQIQCFRIKSRKN